MGKKKSNPMWGGHYDKAPAEILASINQSISFDKKLYAEDITASVAHCRMLIKQKIISKKDGKAIIAGLGKIKKEIESGEFVFRDDLEDIHMNIEYRLKELIGDAAGRLHTARSRNDQVATDFRLWVKNAFSRLDRNLEKLQQSLLKRAAEFSDTIIPGFTHLQPAQPVTLGHHLLAYVEMFGRDRCRVESAIKRLNESPLGAAALAGTSFPIDRNFTARELGFDKPMANSIDAVSDRDFALDFLSAASICSVHLSRLAEEFVIWSTPQFGFIKLSNSFTTGSSIMPQKRNPDAAELVRGKSGRIFGSLTSLLTTMKGLPLAYSKDMQEDKVPVFEAEENLTLCVLAMEGMVKDFRANKQAMRKAAEKGFLTATDLADWLVQKLNIPFRDAHHITGKIVLLAEGKKCLLHEVPLKDMQKIHAGITKDIFNVLKLENSVSSRKSYGGTSPKNVKESARNYKKN